MPYLIIAIALSLIGCSLYMLRLVRHAPRAEDLWPNR